jgi:hypothetical protein
MTSESVGLVPRQVGQDLLLVVDVVVAAHVHDDPVDRAPRECERSRVVRRHG